MIIITYYKLCYFINKKMCVIYSVHSCLVQHFPFFLPPLYADTILVKPKTKICKKQLQALSHFFTHISIDGCIHFLFP